MRFIVRPQVEAHVKPPPPACSIDKVTTQCALCSEDPRFCPPPPEVL